jgi:hypothetical protein
MSKTTAHTFTAAVVLFLACMAISQYGDRLTENGMSTPDGQFVMYDAYDMGLKTHERVAGLIGLLSFSVAGAGALLWERDIYPRAQRASVLGLEGGAGRRIIRAAVPRKSMAAAKINVEDSGARLHEDESLTPLERVIRGY